MTPWARRPTPQETVGARVRALREELGWRQLDLAKRARVHTTYIPRLEAGRVDPSLSHLTEIAYALDVNLATLVTDVLPTDLRGRHQRRRPSDDASEP
jgi:transcriptional regulator with XRE-family HTH domain